MKYRANSHSNTDMSVFAPSTSSASTVVCSGRSRTSHTFDECYTCWRFLSFHTKQPENSIRSLSLACVVLPLLPPSCYTHLAIAQFQSNSRIRPQIQNMDSSDEGSNDETDDVSVEELILFSAEDDLLPSSSYGPGSAISSTPPPPAYVSYVASF